MICDRPPKHPRALSFLGYISLLALPLLLGGCGGEEERGSGHLCLMDYEGVDGVVGEAPDLTADLTGILVADRANPDYDPEDYTCAGHARRFLEVETPKGGVVTMGYGVGDAAGADITPALDVAPGQGIRLRYWEITPWGTAYAFLLEDDAGLVAALDLATFGSAMDDAALAELGLAVRTGAVVGHAQDDCGKKELFALDFETSEDALTLEPVETGALTLGGASYAAYALRSMDWSGQPSCTDTTGVEIWMVSRE